MSKAVSAYGATLSVNLNGQWRRFSEVSSIAELGDTAKTIDATRFGDSRISYIKDCSDQSLMQFNMYAVPTSKEDSNLAIIKEMDEDATYDFQTLPLRSSSWYSHLSPAWGGRRNPHR